LVGTIVVDVVVDVVLVVVEDVVLVVVEEVVLVVVELVLVVVEEVVLVVVDDVVLVVVDVVLVVVVVGFSRAATNAAAQDESTIPSTVALLLSGGRQSLGVLLSSFAKQPLVGSVPPSNLAFALSTH
jgi:hypothetical protein